MSPRQIGCFVVKRTRPRFGGHRASGSACHTSSDKNGSPSGTVESVEVHDLVPGGDEVAHELLLRVVCCVDLGEGSELRVGAEDEVDGGGGPLEHARSAVATLGHVLGRVGW